MSRHSLSRRAFFAAGSALAAGFATCALADEADAQDKVIEGSVIYRERMMLPRGARVEVQLVDVSLADAPAVVLASATVTDAAASPVRYRLSYDPALVESGHRYALQARISIDDRLLFINDTHHAFEPGQSSADIPVVRVAAQPEQEALALTGSWLAEDILGGGVIDNVQTTLIITEDGTVSGMGGCNGYGGTARIDGEAIEFGQIVSTQMACAEAIMNQELTFFDALGRVASFRILQEERKLLLLDEGGEETLVRLAAM